MSELITLPWKLERAAPPFEGNDIKFPESFARYVIGRFSPKGGKVFDPFAGLGTTLFMAEEMGRTPFGFEMEPNKQEWVAGQLEHWTHHIHDDAFHMDKYNLPKMDLVLTSPPYMPRHHNYNPLFGGDPAKAGYNTYLRRMKSVFKKVSAIM
jgi:DNA modification methylase